MDQKIKERIKKQINNIDNERAEVIKNLFENDGLYIPELILQLVFRARAMTKTIHSLNLLLQENEN